MRGHRDHLQAGERRLAEPQEDRAGLVLGLQADEDDGRRLLEIAIRDGQVRGGDVRGQEVGLLGGVHAGPEVDVVGAQHGAREHAVRERVLGGQASARQHADAAFGSSQPSGCDGQGGRPRCRLQLAVLVPHERVAQAVVLRRPGEAEPVLVGDPLLVDLGVVAGEPAHDLAAPVVDADGRAARVVLGHGRRRDEVERAGPEPVVGAGEGADGADLDGVAGEIGVERHVVGDAHLLLGTALEHGDERVAGDLLGEAGAAGAQHAALAVEQHLRGHLGSASGTSA